MYESNKPILNQKQFLAIIFVIIIDAIALFIVQDLFFAMLIVPEVIISILFGFGITEKLFKGFYTELPDVHVSKYKSGSSNNNNKVRSFHYFKWKESQLFTTLMILYLVFDLVFILTLKLPFLVAILSLI
jgi:hypothetical protein